MVLLPLTTTDIRDLLEIVEARSRRGSTIFCSQFEVNGWYQKIGDETIADAICDRIIHNAYTILLKGDSLRKMNGAIEEE
jgi:DNA replication protein DnaC